MREVGLPLRDKDIHKQNQKFFHSAQDLFAGAKMYQLWGRLGWNDLLQRYQRSILGPLWLTISMGVLIGALGILYASLFKINLENYLPFLTIGFVLWQFISGILLDSCSAYVSAEGIIKQIKLPFSIHIYRLLWRNFITFLHNAVVIIIVLVYFNIGVSWQILLVLPGLIIIILIGVSFGLLLGMIVQNTEI